VFSLGGYGFSGDPFPLVPEAAVHHWAGRKDVQREVIDVVESVRVTDVGTSEFVILHGTYGAGKSHALRFLSTLINEVRADEFRSRAIYIPSIRVDQKVTFVGIYVAIVNQLGLDFIKRLATKIHTSINAAEEKLKSTLPREDLLRLMDHKEGGINGVRLRAYDGANKEDVPMIRLLDEIARGNENAIRFILGKNETLPNIGFPSPIDTDFMATKVLGGLFRAMTIEVAEQDPPCLGAYLFLDEFEAIIDMKTGESGPILNSIRELVNHVPYHLCLLLSFSADTALIEAVVPQALIQRLSRDYIEFPPLEAEEAKLFLAAHFKGFRPADFLSSNPYHPFEEATIELVLEQITEMTPRNIFRKLRMVLERAIRRNDLQPGAEISPELAESILTNA